MNIIAIAILWTVLAALLIAVNYAFHSPPKTSRRARAASARYAKRFGGAHGKA